MKTVKNFLSLPARTLRALWSVGKAVNTYAEWLGWRFGLLLCGFHGSNTPEVIRENRRQQGRRV